MFVRQQEVHPFISVFHRKLFVFATKCKCFFVCCILSSCQGIGSDILVPQPQSNDSDRDSDYETEDESANNRCRRNVALESSLCQFLTSKSFLIISMVTHDSTPIIHSRKREILPVEDLDWAPGAHCAYANRQQQRRCRRYQ